jgi:hypothetical protein
VTAEKRESERQRPDASGSHKSRIQNGNSECRIMSFCILSSEFHLLYLETFVEAA